LIVKRPKTGDEIRSAFLEFFREREHMVLPSSSLVPTGDPTLLLTSAGMVQFKPYFTGEAVPPQNKLTTVQKCFRVTDIEEVGDANHLTFFEMLGNFSIGDYFKHKAIEWAWEFVTTIFQLPKDRLWATVYEEDAEAEEIWITTGIPASRIRRFGEADNYWGPAGSEGPCGPCSEIHYDFGGGCRAGKAENACGPNCECGRFIELWNLVFMQFYQDAGGARRPLPRPNVDTGMGLERAALILQDVESIYETEIFLPIVSQVAGLAGVKYGNESSTDYAIRVVAEHARSATFLIADGVIPGNEGKDYVLRKVIRRGIRFANKLGIIGPCFSDISDTVVQHMCVAYPELRERDEFLKLVLDQEEERFGEAISVGLPLLEQELIPLRRSFSDSATAMEAVANLSPKVSRSVRDTLGSIVGESARLRKMRSMISGPEAFLLYDTYGFPLDLTQEIAYEHGMEVDLEGFETEMELQRGRGRTSGKFSGTHQERFTYDSLGIKSNRFKGYDNLGWTGSIAGLIVGGQLVESVHAGTEVEIVLDETPFYAMGGGQVGDTGEIVGPNGRAMVLDTNSPASGIISHRSQIVDGFLQIGQTIYSEVDAKRRGDIKRNHTATHMLHSALRSTLGAHVRQAGSLVEPDRLRFDFTHVAGVTPTELRAVELLINEMIRANVPCVSTEGSYQDAIDAGALAFFEDRYGDSVRTLRIGNNSAFSYEVCGGTHIQRTGEIGCFSIVSENGIGTGIRRIEALTGSGAFQWISERLALLNSVSERLNTNPDDLAQRIDNLLYDAERGRKAEDARRRDTSLEMAKALVANIEIVSGIPVIAAEVKTRSMENLREIGDRIKDNLNSGIVVLGAIVDERPLLLSMVTPDLVLAGYSAASIVKAAAPLIKGGGGGRPDVAQAGGKDPSKLSIAIAAAIEEISLKGE
jgi:alanyl-tRNA synthetase